MAYPTKESNDREGGSPNEAQSDQLGQFVEDETKQNSSPFVDRAHPHQNPEDRKIPDHPHSDLKNQT